MSDSAPPNAVVSSIVLRKQKKSPKPVISNRCHNGVRYVLGYGKWFIALSEGGKQKLSTDPTFIGWAQPALFIASVTPKTGQVAYTPQGTPIPLRNKIYNPVFSAINAFIFVTSVDITVNRCGKDSMLSKPTGRSASRPSASLIVSLNLAGKAVSSTIIGTPGSVCSNATLIPSAV